MIGKVKWFDSKKGYGFIVNCKDNSEVFIHQTNILMQGYRELKEGQPVQYEVDRQADGRGRAVNVELLAST